MPWLITWKYDGDFSTRTDGSETSPADWLASHKRGDISIVWTKHITDDQLLRFSQYRQEPVIRGWVPIAAEKRQSP